MKHKLGAQVYLNGVLGYVALINYKGDAYIATVDDGEGHGPNRLLRGCVFAVVDVNGKDKEGHKVTYVKETSV